MHESLRNAPRRAGPWHLDTIYVTAKGANKLWGPVAPSAGRPEALPVWSHARKQQSAPADAVSGATPKGGVHRELSVSRALTPGSHVVKLEVNSSFDYNERYTKSNSGVNGQPSLLYSCAINVGQGQSTGEFALIGTGSVDGADGEIWPDVSGITTAREIMNSAEISCISQPL